MKKYFLILAIAITSVSCKNTWDSESKEMYHSSCMDDAKTWAGTPDKAKEYCDCALETIMKKYPSVNDFMENADKVISDPDIRKCRENVMAK
jgi:hypothetical protein